MLFHLSYERLLLYALCFPQAKKDLKTRDLFRDYNLDNCIPKSEDPISDLPS